jgi:hypothetical protein
MQDLKFNADGSIDLFIGAKAPAGFESNYMKTVGRWLVCLLPVVCAVAALLRQVIQPARFPKNRLKAKELLTMMSATTTQSILSAAQIAEDAFIYGFPLIMNYGIMYAYSVNPNSGQYKAPFNQIFNEANVFTPKDTAVITPNSDTPYSMLFMDLRAEPVVLSVPDVETGAITQCRLPTSIRIIMRMSAAALRATRLVPSWSQVRARPARCRVASRKCSGAKPCFPQPRFVRSSLALLILIT